LKDVIVIYNEQHKYQLEFYRAVNQAVMNIQFPDDIDNSYSTSFTVKGVKYFAAIVEVYDRYDCVISTSESIFKDVVVLETDVEFSARCLASTIASFLVALLLGEPELRRSV